MVYDFRTCRITTAFRSRLHVQADSLLLTSSLRYLIAVQRRCVVIWRLEELASAFAYNKYMTDDFPADDHDLSDTDYFYDDDTQDAADQVAP